MRHIEEHTLEEQHKRHPLIIRVIPLLAIIDTQTRMGHMSGHGFRVIFRQRERVRNPAVSVDHVIGTGQFRYTVDRITCAEVDRQLGHDEFFLSLIKYFFY